MWRTACVVVLAAVLATPVFSAPPENQSKSGVMDYLAKGAVIAGFRVPRFDAKGELIGELLGKRAMILDESRVKVEDMSYQGKRDGKMDFEIISEKCTFDQRQSLITSDGTVKFTRTGVEMSGHGFVFDIRSGKGTISSKVEMIIHDIEKGLPK